jgi:hypothetical protein
MSRNDTAQELAERESDDKSWPPKSAELLGYNHDARFFHSASLNLVFIVQKGTVWTLPSFAPAAAASDGDR